MNITKVLTDNDLSNIEKIVLMYLYDINNYKCIVFISQAFYLKFLNIYFFNVNFRKLIVNNL